MMKRFKLIHKKGDVFKKGQGKTLQFSSCIHTRPCDNKKKH